MTVDFSVVPVCVENEIKTDIKEEETQKKPPIKQESVNIVKKILEDRAAKNKSRLTNQEKSTETNQSPDTNSQPTETETKLPIKTTNDKYLFSKGFPFEMFGLKISSK